MAVERINYRAGETACTGALVYDDSVSGPRPLLLMSPKWLGVSDNSINRAGIIAGSKYVVFVADMYGGGKILPARRKRVRLPTHCAPMGSNGATVLLPRLTPCVAKASSARLAISNAKPRSASVLAAAMFLS